MAALRRNPPRQNRPPRRADSPVSFAVMGPLAASQDLSDSSDIEILEGPPVVSSAPVVEDLPADAPPAHPLSLRVLQDHFRYSSTDSSTDSDEPSTEAPSRPREFPLLSPLLSPRNGPDPSVASLMSQVDAPGLTIQERAALLIAEIHRLQGTVQHITDRQPSPTAMPEASLPPEDSVYFVGLQTLTASQSFCQRLTLVSPDRNTLSRLTEAGFPLGRALGTLQNHHEYLVGTADIPVEISGDYMAIRNNFQELGSWHGLETAPESSLASLAPIPDSNVRTDLLSRRRLNQITLAAFAPAPTPSAVSSDISAYLLNQYRSTYNDIAGVLATPYGTAYKQCLLERYCMQICGALNIIFARQIIPSLAGGFSIRPEHVADAAQINPVSFNGMRTKFSKVRQARRLLQGYQYQNQTADAGGEQTVLPHGAVGLVESHIVSMSISPFMTDIEEVISALN
ncbi:hypothetical protein C8J57DRAFT_1501105 [Mycena rebaudengoi]|nr:hypothetical protein C8J57DRAFT_1501105 [Mycena rebaudengoi]